MWEEIAIGDYVTLRTGGPVMLLQALDDAGLAFCVWEEKGKRQTGQFLKIELRKVEKEHEGLNGSPEPS